jgi:predicted dinucleotide-binding enzyme
MTSGTYWEGVILTTAIIGTGNIGSAVARHLVRGDETVVVAARDASEAEALAAQLGPRASAAPVKQAIAAADMVVLALWLDEMKAVIAENAQSLEGKVVIDPSHTCHQPQRGTGVSTPEALIRLDRGHGSWVHP